MCVQMLEERYSRLLQDERGESFRRKCSFRCVLDILSCYSAQHKRYSHAPASYLFAAIECDFASNVLYTRLLFFFMHHSFQLPRGLTFTMTSQVGSVTPQPLMHVVVASPRQVLTWIEGLPFISKISLFDSHTADMIGGHYLPPISRWEAR